MSDMCVLVSQRSSCARLYMIVNDPIDVYVGKGKTLIRPQICHCPVDQVWQVFYYILGKAGPA